MASRDDVGSRLGLKVETLVPIDGHILDELEGVHETGIVFG